MDGAKKEIECHSPIRQVGKVRKGLLRGDGVVVSAIIDEDCEEGGKCVKREERAQESEDGRGEKPRSYVSGRGIEGRWWVEGGEEGFERHGLGRTTVRMMALLVCRDF